MNVLGMIQSAAIAHKLSVAPWHLLGGIVYVSTAPYQHDTYLAALPPIPRVSKHISTGKSAEATGRIIWDAYLVSTAR